MDKDYNKIKPQQLSTDNIQKDIQGEPKFKSLVETPTVQPKPPIHARINHFVFGDEGFTGVAKGIMFNVFIPVIKRAVLDTGHSVLHRILYPNGGGPYQNGYYSGLPTNEYQQWRNGSYTSYNAPGKYQRQPTMVTGPSPAQPTQYDKAYAQAQTMDVIFEKQIFATKEQAESVFIHMIDSIDRFGRITLGDYLTMCGHRPDSTKWSYGWLDLSNVFVRPYISGGYFIDLPKPRVL